MGNEYEFKYKPSMKVILMNFRLDLKIQSAILKNQMTPVFYVHGGPIGISNELPELFKKFKQSKNNCFFHINRN